MKWTDFQNDRLYYKMSKNGEHGSVKIPNKVICILKQYEANKTGVMNEHNLVFPLLQNIPTLDNDMN